jgi:CRP-like cAMP-binding protein
MPPGTVYNAAMESEALAKHSFIKGMGLTEEEIAAVAAIGESRATEADTVIFREGETADALYLTTTGRVRIANLITQKLEKVLYTVPADNVFGEMGLLDQGMRSATAEALDTAEIIAIPRDRFLEVLKGNAQLGLKLMLGLYDVVVDRLRLMDMAYAQNIRWGVEVSGATRLDFSELISGDVPVEFTMNGGERLKGRIVKVNETAHDIEFTVASQDSILIIPYGSVSFVTFGKTDDLVEH